MGDSQYFHIESKSFELIKDACTNGLYIIKYGKNHMSNAILGREGVIWLRFVMAQAATSPPDQNILKTKGVRGPKAAE